MWQLEKSKSHTWLTVFFYWSATHAGCHSLTSDTPLSYPQDLFRNDGRWVEILGDF